MKVSDFDFELPKELIAQEPAARRDGSRLLHLPLPGTGAAHLKFADFPSLLRENDVLVVNNTRVLPARLFVRKELGGRVELLFSHPLESEDGTEIWEAMARSSRPMRPQMKLWLADDAQGEPPLAVHSVIGGAFIRVRNNGPQSLTEILERHGRTPLPPYISREGDRAIEQKDRRRYQTVYAEEPGAVAAPTAGLHFTPEILDRISDRGIEIVKVTLHVGPGTFLPLRNEDVERNKLHVERYSIDGRAATTLSEAVRVGKRLVAVGTTTARVLESADLQSGEPQRSATQLFVYPGYQFRHVGALLTNFHLPKSSLIVLVSALAGRERILAAYREAVQRRYRFFSYGDAMFIG